ncbi:MAG TPA: hypothetical protein VGG11_05600 [Xanthobacteraceae bacterium]|jgi:hypothetical protein
MSERLYQRQQKQSFKRSLRCRRQRAAANSLCLGIDARTQINVNFSSNSVVVFRYIGLSLTPQGATESKKRTSESQTKVNSAQTLTVFRSMRMVPRNSAERG